jgi:hypothetical protein
VHSYCARYFHYGDYGAHTIRSSKEHAGVVIVVVGMSFRQPELPIYPKYVKGLRVDVQQPRTMAATATMVLPDTSPVAPSTTAGIFDTEPFDVAQDDNEENPLSTLASSDEFDPFDIAVAANAKKMYDGATPKNDQVTSLQSPSGISNPSRGSTALPPRIVVKFMIQEEVMSAAIVGTDNEGASSVVVRGTLQVREVVYFEEWPLE